MKTSLRNSIFGAASLTVLACALPTLAYAHPGDGAHGLSHGLAHPFTGLDHLFALLAVGLWAAQLGGRSAWQVPLTFLSIMALGGLLGMAAIPLPFVEAGIVASLLTLGLLIATGTRLPLALSAIIAGVFALFHGHAHGAEMASGASVAAYASGFLAATALLHFSGYVFGMAMRAQLLRLAGAAVAAAGGYLLFAA